MTDIRAFVIERHVHIRIRQERCSTVQAPTGTPQVDKSSPWLGMQQPEFRLPQPASPIGPVASRPYIGEAYAILFITTHGTLYQQSTG